MITYKHITKFIISKQITLKHQNININVSKTKTMQAITDITQGINIHPEY